MREDGAITTIAVCCLGRAAGHETHPGTMTLALAMRHSVERPAISMEGGTKEPYGAALPAAV